MFPNTPSNSALNKLTHLAIQAFVARAKADPTAPRKVFDGGGLFIFVSKAGSPLWRLKYRLGGKEANYSIGAFPAVSIDDARRQRDALRAQISEGKSPIMARRLRRATALVDGDNTFAHAAEEWLAMKKSEWSPFHLKTSRRALERDIFPRLGRLPVTEIKTATLAAVIEKITQRGTIETASKILQHCGGIFRYCKAKGWCDENPADGIREILPKKKLTRPIPAILEFQGLGDILRRAEAARLSPQIRMAHRLTAFTAARMGNVTTAEWPEFQFDLDPGLWVIPRAKMKAQGRLHDHKVVLCRPIVRELLEWRNITGGQGFLFPTPEKGGGQKPISREGVEKAYRATLQLKGRHAPHGWRASFATLAKDNGFSRDVVEMALDHVHDSEIVRAYDRGERMEERIRLMTWWGDRLEEAQKGGALVPFRKFKAA